MNRCEFCGSLVPLVRVCADCTRFYCPDCAASGEGETIEECCQLCQLYSCHTVKISNSRLLWVFEGRIAGTSVDVHTAHKSQIEVLDRAREVASSIIREKQGEQEETKNDATE